MIRKELTITNPDGLQSRPAALLVQVACKFNARILIEKGQKVINAKSMMGVLSLGIAQQGTIMLVIEGEDEAQAFAALSKLIASDFKDIPTKG